MVPLGFEINLEVRGAVRDFTPVYGDISVSQEVEDLGQVSSLKPRTLLPFTRKLNTTIANLLLGFITLSEAVYRWAGGQKC